VPELYWCSLCDIALNAMVLAEHLDFRLASTQQAERARSELRTFVGASHEILLTVFSAKRH
jgi:hypothetical protein